MQATTVASRIPPSAAPTPMPTVAPVDRPLELLEEEEEDGVWPAEVESVEVLVSEELVCDVVVVVVVVGVVGVDELRSDDW